ACENTRPIRSAASERPPAPHLVRNMVNGEPILAVNTQDPYAPDQDDIDPQETAEWRESLDAVVEARGAARGREVMTSLLDRSRQLHLNVPMVPTTDYVNTIASADEPDFPGDEPLEREYRHWIRWN